MATETMAIEQALLLAAFGAVFGAVGQTVRAIAGLKKLGDASSESGVSVQQTFQTASFLVSLLIGAAAGVLAALTLSIDTAQVSPENVFSVLAAGYAGADFIEAFMRGRGSAIKPPPAGGETAAPPAGPSAVG